MFFLALVHCLMILQIDKRVVCQDPQMDSWIQRQIHEQLKKTVQGTAYADQQCEEQLGATGKKFWPKTLGRPLQGESSTKVLDPPKILSVLRIFSLISFVA